VKRARNPAHRTPIHLITAIWLGTVLACTDAPDPQPQAATPGEERSEAAAAAKTPAAERELILATTTSVRDTGLLDALLPDFEKQSGVRVRPVAVGTGAALRMGRDGAADLLLTHAPAAEQRLVDEGIARQRIVLMENYFVIAGPADDPAAVGKAETIEEALRGIARKGAPFISRGDDSGTHKREQALLKAAGLEGDGALPGLTETGGGMGLSLQVAGEKRAYILSDLGTFLAFKDKTQLLALSKREPSLRNIYALLPIDPKRFPNTRARAAQALVDYLLEPETQRRIGEIGRERFGTPLFHPIAGTAPVSAGHANEALAAPGAQAP